MTLSEIEINQCARIEFIESGCNIKRRLQELGFIKGQKIICSDIAVSGSPMAFKLCGTKIALRKKDARAIGVTI